MKKTKDRKINWEIRQQISYDFIKNIYPKISTEMIWLVLASEIYISNMIIKQLDNIKIINIEKEI